MTDEQFQNYLALLKGLLKLSNRERDAIAEELSQHMDDRLAELLQRGMPHDEAVRCALEEFGDAAGVAQRFLQVDHFKRRRRIMRMTFGSFAILGVLAIAFMLLPQDDLHQSLVAQGGGDTQVAVNSSANGVEYLRFQNPRDEKTEKRLEVPIELNYTDTPFSEVVADLGNQLGVTFVVDVRALEALGLSAESMQVNLQLSGISANTGLELLLDQLDLTYVIRDGVMFVTTPGVAVSFVETRVYPLGDLLGWSTSVQETQVTDSRGVVVNPDVLRRKLQAFGKGEDEFGLRTSGKGEISIVDWFDRVIVDPSVVTQNTYQQRSQELLRIIVKAVDSDSWDASGVGAGTLEIYRGALIAKASSNTHRKLQKLLNELKSIAQQSPATGNATESVSGLSRSLQ